MSGPDTSLVQPEYTTTVVYAVYNDPEAVQRAAEQNQWPPTFTETFSRPLFESAVPGAAKRFQKWTNEQRSERGETMLAVLRTQTTHSTPWRTLDGQEYDDIDDGRRANG